jgi:magnesium transporter
MLLIFDNSESVREMISGLLEIYLSSVSNRMNEVMKVLTLIATIFIPLTFIAGVYGMNFTHMPELKWHYGYFITLGLMGVVAMLMIIFFRRKKWL